MELRKSVFEASEEAFDLPLETKLSTKSDKLYKGYVGQVPTIPLYEGLGFDGADNPEVVDDLTHKLWPQSNITFRFSLLYSLICLYNLPKKYYGSSVSKSKLASVQRIQTGR